VGYSYADHYLESCIGSMLAIFLACGAANKGEHRKYGNPFDDKTAKAAHDGDHDSIGRRHGILAQFPFVQLALCPRKLF